MHIADALTYLHSLQPIVLHRDLKSKNILLDDQLNAKLTDFGISRECSGRTMIANVGTSLWMAPEVMMGGHYDEKSDIFSFGIVLSELDSHTLPYSQVKESKSGRHLHNCDPADGVDGKTESRVLAECVPSNGRIGERVRGCESCEPTDRG